MLYDESNKSFCVIYMASVLKTRTTEELRIDCEVAAEVLAECFAYFSKQLAEEKRKSEQNADKIATLEKKLRELHRQQMALGPDDIDVVNNALYVWAPLLNRSSLLRNTR